MEEAHAVNTAKVWALDGKICALHSAAASLANHSLEALAGYGRLISALDVRQQVILRCHNGSFIRPTVVPLKLKQGAKAVPSGAVASAQPPKK